MSTTITTIGIIVIVVLATIGALNFYLILRAWLSGPPASVTTLQYARLRLEWESACVTYRTVPYFDDKTLDISMQLAAALRMREESSTDGKKYVEDKVKAVTLIHKNWPKDQTGDGQK